MYHCIQNIHECHTVLIIKSNIVSRVTFASSSDQSSRSIYALDVNHIIYEHFASHCQIDYMDKFVT